jgi:hypothetical protein
VRTRQSEGDNLLGVARTPPETVPFLTFIPPSLRYDERVKSKTKTAEEYTGISPFDKFTKVMDGLMSVPHSDLKHLLDQEKKRKARKKRARTSRASHASGGKG